MVPMTRRQPLLGAVELIEMGSPVRSNEIFREERERHEAMGQSLGEGGGILDFFGNILSTGFKTVADVVDAPLSFIGEGVGWVFTNLASILGNIPILGEIVAALLLVINSAIQFVLKIPGFILENLGKAFTGLSSAFGKAFSSDDQKSKLSTAKNDLVKKAPENIKSDVNSKLSADVSTTGEPDEEKKVEPAISTETILLVGAAGAVAAALVL